TWSCSGVVTPGWLGVGLLSGFSCSLSAPCSGCAVPGWEPPCGASLVPGCTGAGVAGVVGSFGTAPAGDANRVATAAAVASGNDVLAIARCARLGLRCFTFRQSLSRVRPRIRAHSVVPDETRRIAE